MVNERRNCELCTVNHLAENLKSKPLSLLQNPNTRYLVVKYD